MLTFDKKTNTATLNGPIGSYFLDGTGPDEFDQVLFDLAGEDFTLRINSEGGDVFEGLAMANRLYDYEGEVTAVIDGLAASIASVIAVSADSIQMHRGSMMMIHSPWSGVAGNAKALRSVADLLDKIEIDIAGFYATKTGKTTEEFMQIFSEGDVYYNASEALEMGLADSLLDGEKKDSKEKSPAVATAASFPQRAAARLRLAKEFGRR